jgi:hypothetical protein
MRLATLPSGTKGFDANTHLSAAVAALFVDAGYRFAVRYVRRDTPHSYDLSAGELIDLLRAGLGIMVVQHVAPPGWHPTGPLGHAYGAIAAAEARSVGVPRGVTVWCDLEGVGPGVPAAEVILYCNLWHEAVLAAGYAPGLYVGDSCGLSAEQLYRRLRFTRYWGAYNLNADQVPAVRGLQMQQRASGVPDRVAGVPFEFDVNVIAPDALGGSPVLLLP